MQIIGTEVVEVDFDVILAATVSSVDKALTI